MNSLSFINPDMFFYSLNHREKRYVTYPSGTAIGLLVAIALPVDVPEENLYFSLNFEANYNLPDNITQYHNSDIAKALHSISRRSTYNLLQNQFTRLGYNGEECLLKLICEVSSHDIPTHGLVESIFHVVFKPSRSLNESLPEKYYQAEIFGLDCDDCDQKYADCDVSVLGLFSEE